MAELVSMLCACSTHNRCWDQDEGIFETMQSNFVSISWFFRSVWPLDPRLTGEPEGRSPLDDVRPHGWGNEQTVRGASTRSWLPLGAQSYLLFDLLRQDSNSAGNLKDGVPCC